ncbi:hypothetical protein NQ318_003402, partial [Aromia moschata]
YVKLRTRWCISKVCLLGKTAIVTGANTGIGYETALEFAKRGARVILGCRNEAKAIEARDKIIKETSNQNVVVKRIDFSSLKSVRHFAKDVEENEERLDILVNNAGVGMARDALTEDGLQFLMQVNYYGPFLLTILLIDKLKKSSPSRIVNVSSLLASFAKLDVDNPNIYGGPYYYNSTKLCNILFSIHLAKILEKHNVTVYSVHPGAVRTEIYRVFRGIYKTIVEFLKAVCFKTPEEGAQTVIHTAIHQGIEQYTGRIFDECRVVKTYANARDPYLPDRLWNRTVELLKCEEDIKNM